VVVLIGRRQYDDDMQGYVVEVRDDGFRSAAPKIEEFYVLCEDERTALVIFCTDLRLNHQTVQILRTIPDKERKALRLKPFQVKRA
jgi:hypothetical protein